MRCLLDIGEVRAESVWTDLGGRRIHHLEAGSGEPLVLIHGAGGGAANWFRIMAPLARRYQVLAPDVPGFGMSDPVDPEAPLGVCIADHLRSWMDRVGIARCDLVGTSFGGLVAARLALRAPGRVRRLALIASAGLGREMNPLVRLLSLPLLGRWILRPTPRGTRLVFRLLLTSERRSITPELERAMIEYLLRSDEAGDPAVMARAYRLFCSPVGQRERLAVSELASLEMPILLVWGERDVFFPCSQARRAAAAIPGARLSLLPRVGHSPNWEAPTALLNTLLPFLSAESALADRSDGLRLDPSGWAV